MALIEVMCPTCESNQVVKFGVNKQGKQRYQCRNKHCKKDTFILDYENIGYLQEIKKQIIEMTLNGSGIRDISRVLGVSINTVLSELKKKKPKSKI
jgi:transposase-like protein